MGEILEKGLIIGFGLTTSLLIISFFSPIFSTLLSNDSTSDQYEIFVLTMEYGLSYIPQFSDEELNVNLSLSFQIQLDIEEKDGISHFIISSETKSNTILVSKSIVLHNKTVMGDLLCVFSYRLEKISLTFWRRD